MEHNHLCHCGTGRETPHEIGKDGCQRFMTDPPKLNKEETMFIYTQQRGYAQHPCGCWSRWPGSTNSLKA